MSESYTVFVKKEISFLEIKSALEKIINISLEKSDSKDWKIFTAVSLGLKISLFEANNYENDGELKLSQYNYEIDVDYIRNVFDLNYASEWRLMGALVVGSLVSKKLHCECIAVKNVQVLLERFLPDEK